MKVFCHILLAILPMFCFEKTWGFDTNFEKIVNGMPAHRNEFPFMVSLRSRLGMHDCGGTILNKDTILTAAHCVCGYRDPLPTIQYGVNEISMTGPTIIQMSKIICHENYTVFGNEYAHNDIAIVKLKSEMILSEAVKPVTLNNVQQAEMEEKGTIAVVTGWGYNSTNGFVQNILQKVYIPLVPYEKCHLRYPERVISSNICAGTWLGGMGQCSGDSGGPLLVNGTQFGIVSWSVKPCASPNNPGVFTRISSFYDWIKRHS